MTNPKTSTLWILVPSLALCGLASACGGESSSNPPPNNAAYQYPPGTQPYPQQPGYQQPPPGYPQQPGYPAPTDPGAAYPQPVPTQPAPSPAPTAPIPTPIGGDAANLAIQALAASQAPGMSPEGQRFDAQIAEGQHAATTVNLQAGKCYSVVAVGYPPGILQLEMHLLAPPLYTTSVSDDVSSTPSAVLGKGSNMICPITPLPVPYKVDIVAKKGSGGVAVQLYSKTK